MNTVNATTSPTLFEQIAMRKSNIVLVLLLVLLALLPVWIQGEKYYLSVLILICLYTALSMSFNLIWGYAGLLSLAHAAFLGIGAYTASILSTRFGVDFLTDILAALVVTLTISFLVGIPALRLARTSFVMVTLAFFLVMFVVAENWESLTNGAMGIAGIQPARVDLLFGGSFFFDSSVKNYYLFLAYAVLVVGIVVRIAHSRVGRVLVAIRQDEILAQSFGIDIFKYKLFVFVVGSTLAGGLGSLYAHYITFIGPTIFDQYWNTRMLLILIVGGRGTIVGVLLSTVIFTLLPELLRFTSTLSEFVFGIVFTLAVILIPKGIGFYLAEWRRRVEQRPPSDA